MRENVNVYENIYINVYKMYMFSYLCYKCLNKKGNVVFFTSFMLRKYKIIMVSIVLQSMC